MRDYEPYYTEDGSIGLYSFADKDVYHSKYGAVTEAWEKFVIPSGIDNLLQFYNEIKILDICYGIGYNTKALMSYIIAKNYKKLKSKNLFQRITYFVSIYINNIIKIINKILSTHIETIYIDNTTCECKIKIDCMDINEEIVKLSPLFKTIKTPGEVFSDFVPQVFDCFDSYHKLKKIYENFASFFYPKNRKEIKELLDIKFKNMHIDREYKVNPIINYILLNKMYEVFGKNYLDKTLKKILTERYTSKFLSKSMIRYAKFNHIWGYSLSSKHNLSTFLHNIYYSTLSKRYNYLNFNRTQSMFDINFYINDARKSIKQINCKYNCVYLDAFSYTKAPQLWSFEFIQEVCNHLTSDGVIITYSNSAQVRNTLLENNLYVGKIYNEKSNKYIGTIASKDKSKIMYPLNTYELGLCTTKAGIPYHDPNLSFTNKEILELREYEFRHSNLMSSSKYMKLRNTRSEDE